MRRYIVSALKPFRIDCQGDREGRLYNTRWRVKQVIWYYTGNPRGRPGGQYERAKVLKQYTSSSRVCLSKRNSCSSD